MDTLPLADCADDQPVRQAAAPVFLFGFERSGTTLLSMMVGAHPLIAVPFSATGLWYRYADRLGRYNCLRGAADRARLVGDLLAEERIGLWDADLSSAIDPADLPPSSYGAVMAKFHQAYAAAKGKPRWGNVDIATLEHMDQANRWFPDARFVHLVRDGRDVALSHLTMPYGASNIADCAEQWSRRVTLNLKMGAVIGPTRYRVVRFEDLILEPRKTLGQLCDFLGVDFDPGMLDYARLADEKVPPAKRWLWPALGRPLQADRVQVWRRELSPVRRTLFERIAGDLLARFGYDRPPPAAGRVRLMLLELWYFLDRGDRFRRIGRRWGFHRRSKLEREAAPADAAGGRPR